MKKGKVLCVIGCNGYGWSTLLMLLTDRADLTLIGLSITRHVALDNHAWIPVPLRVGALIVE